ncbi:peptidyl-tRNA hydrolase [Pseudomassariella vexata]|uniref:peptidyl-tRNA hydrolase n=1 Tax=Pseudomassariella vexata TaxID=1141098 RepID=A0A1Y2EJD5_9PEZI|nr:peptidyl-tRNA hydrolase [Pseudomassariella vexata]ORY71366.1 peptidyl-tRNA hydrolase [Pseudomassariella vexata]
MFRPRFLLLSLGNPAPYYETLHSAGHFALNSAQKALRGSQLPFTYTDLGGKKCLASLTASSSSPSYIMIQSPTLMNVCGPWVAKAYREQLQMHNLKPSELSLVLVHDDLEEDFGSVKLRKWKASHRGHNGVKSVNASLKPAEFPGARWSRISIGIDRPEARDQQSVANYVLRRMTRYQKDVIDAKIGPRVIGCLRSLQDDWEEDFDKASSDP